MQLWWTRRNQNSEIDDDNDDDDVDKCCALDEHSEDMEDDDFALEGLSPKQGGDYWLQGKKRLKQVMRKLEQRLELESQLPDPAVSLSGAGGGVKARCLNGQKTRNCKMLARQ